MISIFSQAKDIASEALFNLLPINFSWVDTRGYILGCNENLLNFLNIEDIHDILGKNVKDFVSAAIWENIKHVIDTGLLFNNEESHEDENGNKTYFLSIKSPVKSKDGKILGIVIISVDITSRKKMELQLEQSKLAVQLADKAKTEFLRNMRHDLRTPFCGIIGSAELLEAKEKDATKKQNLRDIIDSSESLLNHLNEILDYVKTDSGEFPVMQKEFDIQAVLEDVYQMMLPSAKHKKIEFKFLVDKNIPRFLIGDVTRTQRILMNVITNSIKFTDKGYIHVSVGWAEKSDQKCVVQFMIEDTGIGIPHEKKEAIFEKFYRITPSFEGIYHGSGLGLSIVKQFLEEIDGQYIVESDVGKGTTFKIFIPYKVPLLDSLLNEYVDKSECKELIA